MQSSIQMRGKCLRIFHNTASLQALSASGVSQVLRTLSSSSASKFVLPFTKVDAISSKSRINSRLQHASTTQRSKSNVSGATNEQTVEPEDFFGIPENFRLQQKRVSIHSPQSQQTVRDDQKLNEVINEHNINLSSPKSRRERRRVKQRMAKEQNERLSNEAVKKEDSIVTTFGSISFDKTVSVERLKNIQRDLPGLNQKERLSSKVNTEPQKKIEQVEKIPESQEGLFKKQERHLSTNYFDEIYFPEQTLQEKTGQGKKEHNINTSDKFIGGYESSEPPFDGTHDASTLVDGRLSKSSAISSENIFDEQYFSGAIQREKEGDKFDRGNQEEQDSFIEEQYFGTNKSSIPTKNLPPKPQNSDAFNDIDAQYFASDTNFQSPGLKSDSLGGLMSGYQEQPSLTEKDIHSFKPQFSDNNQFGESSVDPHVVSNLEFLKQKKNFKSSTFPEANLSKPTLAYDVAMKIRQDLAQGYNEKYAAQNLDREPWDVKKEPWYEEEDEEEEPISKYPLDSKGYRILQGQTPRWDNMTNREMVLQLKNRIIFNHDDFIALDKPYGVLSFDPTGSQRSLTDLLPSLAEALQRSLKLSELHLIQGLDKDVTGTILLAKNAEVAAIIQGQFNREGEVIQRFWAITKGVPKPSQGVIDIPIGEGKVGDIYKTVLRPLYSNQGKRLGKKTSSAPSYRAITEYKVLCSHLQAAVVECIPLTNNLKHQLRVHLASGLNTPILGDHKYSHFSKLAPQKLHRDMLELLKIRQAKARYLPLHLHCRSVVLNDYKGKTYFLTTRPPIHFKENAQKLKLVIPRQHMKRI